MAPQEKEASVPIGTPVANMQAYVLDAEQRPVPVGVPGELCVSGVGLARGYLNRPELTAEKFILVSVDEASQKRVYRTGDEVFWREDGLLGFRGRMDSQVKYRGFRIELGEIEHAIGQCADIRKPLVIVREDIPGVTQLVAYLVAKEGSSPDTDEIRRFLHNELPSHMVPSEFVILGTIPLLPNGKVDHNSLPKPRPALQREQEAVTARDEYEVKLVRIWEELLEQRPIGIHDNFFDLGGDSLLAMRLLLLIRKDFAQDFSEMSIYSSPTVSQLSRFLRKSEKDENCDKSVIVPIKPEGRRPPFFLAGLAAGDRGRNLAKAMSLERPFYAILTKKLGDEPFYGETVPTASRLIAELKSHQPSGPYYLGTFCNQGAVMLEVAQQLSAQGDQVAMLAMIEAMAPGRRSLSYRLRRSIYRDYHRLKNHFQTMRRLSLWENRRYLTEMYKNSMSRYAKTIDRVRQRNTYKKAQQLGQKPAEELRDSKAVSGLLYQKYVPKPYSGRITVFLGHMSRFLHDDSLGWSALAADVDVHVLSGNHTDMLRVPNVAEFARCLEESMSNAERQFTTESSATMHSIT